MVSAIAVFGENSETASFTNTPGSTQIVPTAKRITGKVYRGSRKVTVTTWKHGKKITKTVWRKGYRIGRKTAHKTKVVVVGHKTRRP
jgi:hypothetical protein